MGVVPPRISYRPPQLCVWPDRAGSPVYQFGRLRSWHGFRDICAPWCGVSRKTKNAIEELLQKTESGERLEKTKTNANTC